MRIRTLMGKEAGRSGLLASTMLWTVLLSWLSIAPCQAAAISWDGGGGNGLWSNPQNWSGDTLPQSGDLISIAGGADVVLDVDFSVALRITVQGNGTTLRVAIGVTLTLDVDSLPPELLDMIEVDNGATLLSDGVVNGGNPNRLPHISVDGVGSNDSIFTNNNTLNRVDVFLRASNLRRDGATFINNGTMNACRISTLGGTVRNAGMMNDANLSFQSTDATNEAGSTIAIDRTSRFLNDTIFDNHGTVSNRGTMTNDSTFNNFGAFDNTGGTFSNECKVLLGVAGTFNNHGTFLGNPIPTQCAFWDNDTGNGRWSDPRNWRGDVLPAPTDGIAINLVGGADTTVTMDIDVTIQDELGLGNATGAPLRTTLIIPSGRTLTIDGRMDAGEETTIRNEGAIINHDKIFAGATIDNQGSIANHGEFRVSCSATFINIGSLSGNPILGRCRTWDGEAGDGLWSNSLNWSDDRLPETGDTISIPRNSGNVLLDVDFTVIGRLTIEGSGAVLTVGDGATLTLDPAHLAVNQFDLVLVRNGGRFVNDGAIEGTSLNPAPFIDVDGTFTNNQTANGIAFGVGSGGTLVNAGTFTTVRVNTLSGIVRNSGQMNGVHLSLQFGSFDNEIAGSIRTGVSILPGGTRFINNVVFNNYGTLTSTAAITNDGTFNNFGTLDTTGATFENTGTLNSGCDSVLLGVISGNQPVVPVCDTTPPVITVPGDVTAEATSAAGAAVSYVASAHDETDGSIAPSCTPASGTAFALGTTSVVCSATDEAGNAASRSFLVHVVDTTPPIVRCDTPDADWHADDVEIACTATDSVTGLAHASDAAFALRTHVPPGTETPDAATDSRTVCDGAGNCIAAGPIGGNRIDKQRPVVVCPTPDGQWHAQDVALTCTGSDFGSGLLDSQDATFVLATHVPPGIETANAATDARIVCDRTANCTDAGPIPGNQVDKRAPGIHCASPDGAWHGEDVELACSAADLGSGLRVADEAGFLLRTHVPAGVETADAATDMRTVCDATGNCADAGPISGNRVDKKAPEILISSPTSSSYLLNQAVASSYTCADGGSGTSSCAGPVASGASFDTSSVGRKTFTVHAADAVGNAAARSVSYDVAYGVCLLYDPGKAKKSGSTIPLKIQLCDHAGTNVSGAGVVVTAVQLLKLSDSATSAVEDAGNSNPDDNFRFDPGLGGSGGYIFNLKTTGLSTGTYAMVFRASGDATTHGSEVIFQIR